MKKQKAMRRTRENRRGDSVAVTGMRSVIAGRSSSASPASLLIGRIQYEILFFRTAGIIAVDRRQPPCICICASSPCMYV